MAHHKRKHSKRSVRCTLCTPHRWLGNAARRLKHRDQPIADNYLVGQSPDQSDKILTRYKIK